MNIKYKNYDKTAIIEDCKENGIKYCIEKYKIGVWTIRNILKKENIKLKRQYYGRVMDQTKLNVNCDDFIKVKTKYHAYILGLLWADGWILYPNNKTTRIELTHEDAIQIEEIFDKTGKWTKYFMKKDSFRKARMGFVCNSVVMTDFLYDNDYKIKSKTSPNKIYSKIPDKYKKYFLLGWSDGDGCFYINEKNKRIEYTMAGSYDQDWSLLENIFKENNITNYRVKRKIMKNGNRYSIVRILAKDQIKLLKNILYGDGFSFGLKRKFEKLDKIIKII